MTVERVPFEEVFDGSANLAPKALVRLPLQEVVGRHHLEEVHGKDGLDAFVAVPLALTTRMAGRVKLALWRHAGNPEGTFAIHLPLAQIEVPGLLHAILHDLDIPEGAIFWRAPDGADLVQAGYGYLGAASTSEAGIIAGANRIQWAPHSERTLLSRPTISQHPSENAVSVSFNEFTVAARETEEVPVVAREARVVEEIGVKKEATERVEAVGDAVRREATEVMRVVREPAWDNTGVPAPPRARPHGE